MYAPMRVPSSVDAGNRRQIDERRVFEELARVQRLALGEQLAQEPGDAGLRRSELGQPMLALGRREIERVIKISVDLRPTRQALQADCHWPS